MSETKKRLVKTSVIISMAVVLILLGVLSLITESFAVEVALHVYARILLVTVIIKFFYKSFSNQITVSMKKMLALCGGIIAVDLVVVDAIRFVVDNGVSSVLFLPACVPVCFMIIMHYYFKDTGKDMTAEKKGSYIVGIPLLLLALYFEILAFI